jgi:molybdopterin synthase catalytic subunit
MHVQETPLRLDKLLAETDLPDCGGLVVFSGTVRDHHDGKAVTRLIYTAHLGVAERVISEIEQEVMTKFAVGACRIQHRIGELAIGEPAVLVVVRAAHRDAAFEGSRYGIDEVKRRAPIWKEEFYADGTRAFVEGCSIADG